MTNKIFKFSLIFIGMVILYIILAITMPAHNEIIVSVNTTLASGAAGNMSQMPGAQEIVETYPVYAWFIPGLIGVVGFVWVAKSK